MVFIPGRSYIHPLWVYYELTNYNYMYYDQLPVGSVGRALHWYRRGHGFESYQSLDFFQAFFLQLLELRTCIAAMVFPVLNLSAVQIMI